MSIDTVAVTGGNGWLGRRVLAALDDVRTVNVSRGERREEESDAFVRADLLDAGESYGALATADADAVVHLGTLPRPDEDPGHVVFRSNAETTYHVLGAAEGLGVDRVVLASSLSALGAGFEPDPVTVDYLPVDESHRLTPSNPYGVGKRAMEVVADGFGRRPDPPTGIASLRFPLVVDDEGLRETFVEPDRTLDGLRARGLFHKARNTLFAYLHADDAVRAVRRALTADLGGHERFQLAAADTNVAVETPELVAEVYPEAEIRPPLDGHAGLIDVSKAEELLDWSPERSWRTEAVAD